MGDIGPNPREYEVEPLEQPDQQPVIEPTPVQPTPAEPVTPPEREPVPA